MVDLDLNNNLNRSNKMLFLDGYGVDLRVDGGILVVKNHDKVRRFLPKRFPFNNVIIDGTRGSISFEAVRWLTKHNSQITFLNWNGRLLSTILPPEAKQRELKFRQYEMYRSAKRLDIARNLIKAKFQRTQEVLNYLHARYPQIDVDIWKEGKRLAKAESIKDIMMIEGRVAEIYWKQFAKLLKNRNDFGNRKIGKTERPMGAVDPVNTLLNYGYSLLEAECRKAINSVGLDAQVGFLHEISIGKEPLVYDLQELFRFLIDLAVIDSFENNVFDKRDFIRTENYNLKLRLIGAKKFVKEVEKQFNRKVQYLGTEYRWSFVILMKARELSQFLLNKRKEINFSMPKFEIERIDNNELRERILKLTNSEARKLRIAKNELWYLKQKAKSESSFKIYKKVLQKIS